MGRSEMWRVKKSLVGTCVFLNKKVEFSQGTLRCQVYEMWGQVSKNIKKKDADSFIKDDNKLLAHLYEIDFTRVL
jgi:hypothetical protein